MESGMYWTSAALLFVQKVWQPLRVLTCRKLIIRGNLCDLYDLHVVTMWCNATYE